MKRAQAEIMGLLVIVILFIFGGLIYMMFSGGEDSRLTRDIRQTGKVQNMLDSYLQVTPCYIEKPYEQMDTIIKGCYSGKETVCGENCKDFIQENLEDLMEVYNPRQSYQFNIKEEGEDDFISIGTCMTDPTTQSTKVATERIVAGRDVLTVKLIYCYK